MSDVSSLLHLLTSGFILDPNVINCMHTITISFSPVYMCACMHRWPLMTLTSLTPLLTPSLVTSLRSSDRPISTGLSTWEMVISSTWLLSVRERERQLMLTDSANLSISDDRLLWQTLNKLNRMHAVTFDFYKGSILVGMTLIFRQTGGQMWTVGPVCCIYISCAPAEIFLSVYSST